MKAASREALCCQILCLSCHNGTIPQSHNLTLIAFAAGSLGVLESLRRFEDSF